MSTCTSCKTYLYQIRRLQKKLWKSLWHKLDDPSNTTTPIMAGSHKIDLLMLSIAKVKILTFCGVGAHHQNVIIENKNKVITTGTQTLLLHGIRMWPQILDNMFWPFAMKDLYKRLNSLQVDILGRTPESILHGVEIQDIPVKSYHTLFCPT